MNWLSLATMYVRVLLLSYQGKGSTLFFEKDGQQWILSEDESLHAQS